MRPDNTFASFIKAGAGISVGMALAGCLSMVLFCGVLGSCAMATCNVASARAEKEEAERRAKRTREIDALEAQYARERAAAAGWR